MIVLTAASTSTSFTCAESVLPIESFASIWISKCRPLCFNSTADGALASP